MRLSRKNAHLNFSTKIPGIVIAIERNSAKFRGRNRVVLL